MSIGYREIARELSEEILASKYVHEFPSEAQLVRRFETSRLTINRAIGELVKSGLVERYRGSGTFVSRKRRQKLGVIGLMAPNLTNAALVESILHVCRREGYILVHGSVENREMSVREREAETHILMKEFGQFGVSGVLMQPIHSIADAERLNSMMLNLFREHDLPVVLLDHDVVDRSTKAPSNCDLVGIDNYRAGFQIGCHLIERGARRIAFLNHDDFAPTVNERMRGVSAAVVEAGLGWNPKRNVFYCTADDESAIAARIRRFGPDAIACGNDTEAAALLKTLRKLRIAVPKRIMVTGFDDRPFAQKLDPPLTTVRQDFEVMAEIAAVRLFHRIQRINMHTCSVYLPAKLIARASTGC